MIDSYSLLAGYPIATDCDELSIIDSCRGCIPVSVLLKPYLPIEDGPVDI